MSLPTVTTSTFPPRARLVSKVWRKSARLAVLVDQVGGRGELIDQGVHRPRGQTPPRRFKDSAPVSAPGQLARSRFQGASASRTEASVSGTVRESPSLPVGARDAGEGVDEGRIPAHHLRDEFGQVHPGQHPRHVLAQVRQTGRVLERGQVLQVGAAAFVHGDGVVDAQPPGDLPVGGIQQPGAQIGPLGGGWGVDVAALEMAVEMLQDTEDAGGLV